MSIHEQRLDGPARTSRRRRRRVPAGRDWASEAPRSPWGPGGPAGRGQVPGADQVRHPVVEHPCPSPGPPRSRAGRAVLTHGRAAWPVTGRLSRCPSIWSRRDRGPWPGRPRPLEGGAQLADPLLLVVADQADAPGQGLAAAAGHAGVDQGVEHPPFRQAQAGHHRHDAVVKTTTTSPTRAPQDTLRPNVFSAAWPAPCARRGWLPGSAQARRDPWPSRRPSPGVWSPWAGPGGRSTTTRISSWSAMTSRPGRSSGRGSGRRTTPGSRRLIPPWWHGRGFSGGAGLGASVAVASAAVQRRAVVVGASLAGLRAAEALRRRRPRRAGHHRRRRAPPSLRPAAAVEADPDRQGRPGGHRCSRSTPTSTPSGGWV